MRKFIQSFVFALRGIGRLLKSERNFRVHAVALIVVILAGIYYSITLYEWALVATVSALVLALEAFNTAIEMLCNELTMERKRSIMIIKDISAGAVLLAAIGAATTGVLIFWKYIFP